jgi:hypothetical protein
MTEQPLSPDTPKANLRASQILCLALMAGAAIFALVMIFVVVAQGGGVMADQKEEYGDFFLYACIGIAALGYLFAMSRYKKGIAATKNMTGSLNDKFNHYRGVLIQYMTPCEGPALFAIIVFFLTGDYLALIIVAISLGLMLYRFPFKQRVITTMGLDWKEQQELE